MSGGPFAAALRRHRLVAGLTQEELAERSGLSTRGISDLERGVKQRPHPETVRLLAAALDLTSDGLTEFRAAAVPRSQTEIIVIPGLPIPMTALFGRDADVQVVSSLIQPNRGARLVTLTGPGGVGKTRLSLQVGEEMRGQFAEGVAFVSLAGLTDPGLVMGAVVQTLGLRELPDRLPFSQLIRDLQHRHLLLVLDNFEHLLPAAPSVAELLAECSGVSVLITSRSPLRLAGELEYPVRPLPLPHLAQGHAPDELMQNPAIQLFVQQARLVQPDFTLTESSAAPVTAICARLDGLPLALELAAVRLKSLAPVELADLLSNRLGVLTGGPRDHPVRQQTMRSAIGWSHDLMSPDQQAVFRQLAVFSDGATREAAAAVASGGDEWRALDDLTALLDQSLLQRREGPEGQSRYAMLETIREYSLEQLVRSGDDGAVRDRHAAWFLQFAEQGEEGLIGPDQVRWMHRLAADYDNLRAGLDWFIREENAESSLRLGSALWRYWAASGRLREGRDWLDRALIIDPDAQTYARGRALLRRGNIAIDLSDFPAAERFFQQSGAIHESLGDEESAARAQGGLGLAYHHQGKLDEAAVAHQATLVAWQALGRRREESMALLNLGLSTIARESYSEARLSLARARAIKGDLSDALGLAFCDVFSCRMERLAGNIELAELLLHSAASVLESHQDLVSWAHVLAEQGAVAGYQGDWVRCVDCHLRAVELWEASGDPLGIIESLEEISVATFALGMVDSGISILASTSTWRFAHSAPAWPAVQRQLDGALEGSREAYAEAFDLAWQRGKVLTIDEASMLASSIVR